jgi:hypothetical protein
MLRPWRMIQAMLKVMSPPTSRTPRVMDKPIAPRRLVMFMSLRKYRVGRALSGECLARNLRWFAVLEKGISISEQRARDGFDMEALDAA